MAVITSPITGESLNVSSAEAAQGFLVQDLNRTFTNADITLRHPEFERSYGQYGARIVSGRIGPADSSAIDKNAASCPPNYARATVQGFQDFTAKRFRTSVQADEVDKISSGAGDYEAILRTIAESNMDGYRARVNKDVDRALTGNYTEGEEYFPLIALDPVSEGSPLAEAVKPLTDFSPTPGETIKAGSWLKQTGHDRTEVLDIGTTFRQYWTEVLTRCYDMTIENNTYTADPLNKEYGARPEDLVIYVPFEVGAASDMKYVQSLRNTIGLDKLPEIRLYHQASTAGYEEAGVSKKIFATLILDKRVVNHVVRKIRNYAHEDDSGCNFATTFTTKVEDMIYFDALYKAFGIVHLMPED